MQNTYRNFGLVIVSLLSFIYALYWSQITIEKYYALNQPVADLGWAIERIWIVTHVDLNLQGAIYDFLYGAGPYFLSPLALFPDERFLLILQASFLGFAAVPLYLISKNFLKSEVQSVFVSIIYLLFFPLAGVNWFSFHFQAMFIILFFTGYYLYLRTRPIASFVLLLMAGLVRFPYIVFIVIFVTVQLFLIFRIQKETILKILGQEKILVFLLVISIALFLSGFFIITHGSSSFFIGYLHNNTAQKTSILAINSYPKFETIIFLFSPLLFLPFFSGKWFPLYLPFIGLLIYTSSSVYQYPEIFSLQYTTAIIPFIMLGFIDVLQRFPNRTIKSRSHYKKNIAYKEIEPLPLNRRQIVVVVVLFITMFSIFLQPYGPLNQFGFNNFSVSNQTDYNITQYNYLMSEINLIPKNSPYVLVQNNMPQVYPRPLLNSTLLIVGQGQAFPTNLSIENAIENSYWKFSLNSWLPFKINYALGDPYNTYFLSQNEAPSMLDFMNVMYASGHYGIAAQEGSIILLQRNYLQDVPILYHPFNLNYSASSFESLLNNATIKNNVLTYSDVGMCHLFSTPSTFVPPGIYNLSITISTSSINDSNHIILDIFHGIATNGSDPYKSGNSLALLNIRSANFTTVNEFETLSFTIKIDQFFPYVYFDPWVVSWNGAVSFKDISFSEISPL